MKIPAKSKKKTIALPPDLHAILKAKCTEREDKMLKVVREVLEIGMRMKGWLPPKSETQIQDVA